ncbi:hypothetical protein DAI22_02g253200 [Oryza sativa Japonica Group]|nr:hypothetical protein DAI22_02g253200 [Oryza sativa Japonica Group]
MDIVVACATALVQYCGAVLWLVVPSAYMSNRKFRRSSSIPAFQMGLADCDGETFRKESKFNYR